MDNILVLWFLFLIVLTALAMTAKNILRKKLRIEQIPNGLFEVQYEKKIHRIAEWIRRIVSFSAYLLVLYLLIYKEYSFEFYMYVLVGILFFEQTTRAIFEWKFSAAPKQAILTMSDLLIMGVGFWILIRFDWLNLIA